MKKFTSFFNFFSKIKFHSEIFVLKAADIVLTTCNGKEYLQVFIIEEVKSFVRVTSMRVLNLLPISS